MLKLQFETLDDNAKLITNQQWTTQLREEIIMDLELEDKNITRAKKNNLESNWQSNFTWSFWGISIQLLSIQSASHTKLTE